MPAPCSVDPGEPAQRAVPMSWLVGALRSRYRRTGEVAELDRAVSLCRQLLDEEGRGLHLIESLSQRWGARRTENGKSVWCQFPLPARRSAD